MVQCGSKLLGKPPVRMRIRFACRRKLFWIDYHCVCRILLLLLSRVFHNHNRKHVRTKEEREVERKRKLIILAATSKTIFGSFSTPHYFFFFNFPFAIARSERFFFLDSFDFSSKWLGSISISMLFRIYIDAFEMRGTKTNGGISSRFFLFSFSFSTRIYKREFCCFQFAGRIVVYWNGWIAAWINPKHEKNDGQQNLEHFYKLSTNEINWTESGKVMNTEQKNIHDKCREGKIGKNLVFFENVKGIFRKRHVKTVYSYLF